jgi:hypothetical protein
MDRRWHRHRHQRPVWGDLLVSLAKGDLIFAICAYAAMAMCVVGTGVTLGAIAVVISHLIGALL